MSRLGPVGVDMRNRVPEEKSTASCQPRPSPPPQRRATQPDVPEKSKHHPGPQKHYTRNRPRIPPVHQRIPLPELVQQPLRRRRIHTRGIRAPRRDDVRIRQRTRERQHASQHAADAPCAFDGAGLCALGPEQVEEEGGAEDGGDEDADEDVERADANVVVVVHADAVGLEVGLLVEVVWRCGLALAGLGGGREGGGLDWTGLDWD
jgi:hypothetical protein